LRNASWIACPLCLLALLAGCATAPKPGPAAPASNADPTRVDPQAPMRDLDVFPRQVPPLLLDALRYPYEAPAVLDCADLGARVRALDAELGPVLDDAARPVRGEHTAARLLIGGVKSSIPYFGWLRRLTGADRRQRLVQAAFAAGYARRGYLKGLGAQLGCVPPAAPTPPAEPAAATGATKR
jgi:hypothetical protein